MIIKYLQCVISMWNVGSDLELLHVVMDLDNHAVSASILWSTHWFLFLAIQSECNLAFCYLECSIMLLYLKKRNYNILEEVYGKMETWKKSAGFELRN